MNEAGKAFLIGQLLLGGEAMTKRCQTLLRAELARRSSAPEPLDLPPPPAWTCSLSTIQDHPLSFIYSYLHYLLISSSLTFLLRFDVAMYVFSFLQSSVCAAHMKKLQLFFLLNFLKFLGDFADRNI